MFQLVKKLILFGIYAMFFYLVFIVFAGEVFPPFAAKNLNPGKDHGFLTERLKEVDTTKNIDILILGSSHAYRGYDPRIFKDEGYRVFNLGSSGQTFLQTEYLLNKYLDSLNPKFVIIDVFPLLFGSDGIESSLDLLSNGRINYDLANLVRKQNHIRLYNNLIFAGYQEMLGLKDNVKDSEKVKDTNDRYISGGYLENTYNWDKPKVVKKREIERKEYQMTAFESILDTLQKRKIEYVIVQAPTTNEMDNSFLNIEDFNIILEQKGSYFNFNKILSLQDHYFIDHSHLNQKGVTVFNIELIKRLEEKQLIPIPHQPPSIMGIN